jgi:hypothetical protein
MLDRRFALAFVTLLAAAAPGCVGDEQDDLAAGGEDTSNEDSPLTPNDEMRYRWVRFARATVQPRLVALGVNDTYIKRAIWFGLSEGIFTIAGNTGYGQKGGARQSPIGFSNCGDSSGINAKTALPDCFGAEGYAFKSGNWQVGIAGAQVTDYYHLIPKLYRDLYGDLPPRLLARSVMRWLNEDSATFPEMSIEQLACANDATTSCKTANARWISVILRDPALNVYVQTHNAWIRDTGRDLGFGKSIVDQVWAEAGTARSSITFPETGKTISGLIGAHWQNGSGRWGCWAENQTICIATWGLPISGEAAVNAPIPGSAGMTLTEQRFERALLQVNQYPDAGKLVQGALLGNEITGQPGNPGLAVDAAFAAYYARYGGLPVFGYPIAAATVQGGKRVQYFERARLEENLEYKPNDADPVWEVLRGHLGRETE